MQPSPDAVTKTIGDPSYLPAWNPDFLSNELGEEGTCARYYPEKRVAVDIGNPKSQVTLKKRRLLLPRGFLYLCIPENCEESQLTPLLRLTQAEFQGFFLPTGQTGPRIRVRKAS